MMTAMGLAKLIEECGELMQVAGKRLAYYRTDVHPDGGPLLSTRMEDEIADVQAALDFVISKFKLNTALISERREHKLQKFRAWDADESNNNASVDSTTGDSRDSL